MLNLDSARNLLAQACRVLPARGLAEGYLGHVSLRVNSTSMLVRCRGALERGLAWTEPDDIRLVNFDGSEGSPGELEGWDPPNELPLHAEVLRKFPHVNAVLHAHPPAVVALDLAGKQIRPIVGAFDIPGARLAADGVPVYEHGVLIRNTELANEMIQAMGARPVVILRGHGLTACGSSVQEAVLRGISIVSIAKLSLSILSAGAELADLPPADLAQLPDLGASFNEGVAWRHEMARIGC